MILFDYVYYLCCRYNRRFKYDRAVDSWREKGLILASVFAMCIIMDVVFILAEFTKYNFISIENGLIIILIMFVLYIIRYNKFTGYADIHEQVLTFSERKKQVLNIAAGVYMMYITNEKYTTYYLKSIPLRKDFQRT